MALTLPTIDANLLASFKGGDLGALEKLFRAIYPALIAKAKESVDDDTAASRVVERLIPHLFADRAKMTSPAAMTEFLDGAVHDAAVRERSRLAGIRKRDDVGKKSSGAAPTADDAWGRIAATIAGPTAEARAQAGEMKEKLRHEAAGHIKQMTKQRPWYVTLGAGVVQLYTRSTADPQF